MTDPYHNRIENFLRLYKIVHLIALNNNH